MTINLDTLRTMVENAGEAWADGEHIDIITPPVVLELITEIESQRAQLATSRKARDKIAKANAGHSARADLYANSLELMEQRALGAEANLEAALNVSRDRLSRLEQAEQAVQRVREVIRQYDPDHLTCMCNSDGDCCKCTVADFQEALDGES